MYGNLFEHRSVARGRRVLRVRLATNTASSTSADDLRPFRFERGLRAAGDQRDVARRRLRIVMPKLRTDPTEFAHLGLSTLEGSTGAIDETFYASRAGRLPLGDDDAARRRAARLRGGRRVGAGRRRPVRGDGVPPAGRGAPPLRRRRRARGRRGRCSPISASPTRAVHRSCGAPTTGSGCPSHPSRSTGRGRRSARELRGAHASAALRALGTLSYPIYVYLSNHGDLFVPAMDTVAFPPPALARSATRAVRWSAQRAFGLRRAGPMMRSTSRPGPRRRRCVAAAATPRRGPSRSPTAAALVRSLFLASAVRLEVLTFLAHAAAVDRARRAHRCTPSSTGSSPGSTSASSSASSGCDDGGTACAGAAPERGGRRPDAHAHYRSMLDYQAGPYADLAALLRDGPDEGRADLDEHATVIAQVSLAAAPFVVPFLAGDRRRASPPPCARCRVRHRRVRAGAPRRRPAREVDGVDLAADVVDRRTRRLGTAKLAGRPRCVGDLRDAWAAAGRPLRARDAAERHLLLPARRTRRPVPAERRALTAGGELVLVTMARTGSIAAAHLHLML